jgi:pyruvate ferredoxin oxidoreductase gamma subunit
LIIQDATLLHRIPLFDGLANSGYVLIDSTQAFQELAISEFAKSLLPERCATLPATTLGLEHVGRPIPNAALLGGFAGIVRVLSIDSVAAAIMSKFPGAVGEKNVATARAAYELVMERNLAHASAG